MPEKLSEGVIVDSSLTLGQALGLKQQIEPTIEVLEKLGIVDVSYYSFDGNLHSGQVVMDKGLLADVKGAFDLITQIKFPIFSVIPSMDRGFMDDAQKAKTVNNSNGFSYRKVAGTEKLSNHSFGRAIDINPEINPYIKGEYSYGLDYDPSKPGTFTKDSVIVQYFKDRGWIWGGDWIDRKDYMHFEKPLEIVEPNVFQISKDTLISKEEYYKKELQGITPDAFFVLGGGNRKIEKDGKQSRYTTSAYRGKFYPQKTGGAKARPVAVAELSEFYPKAKIVVLSHRPSELFQMTEQNEDSTLYPSFSKVLADDLKKLKVRNEIIQEPQPTSTLTEMMEIIKLTVRNKWKNVAVVTNDYQIERSQEIIDVLKNDDKGLLLKNQLQFLFKTGEESDLFHEKWQKFEEELAIFIAKQAQVVFVSAENVLRRRSSHYQKLISELVELEGYKNVIEQEKIGSQKIKEGKYNFAQESFKEYILSK